MSEQTIDQKKNGAATPPSVNPAAFAPPSTLPPAAPGDRMRAYLEGTLEPPNEVAKFVLSRLQETIARGNEVRAQLKQVEAAKAQLEEEQSRLMGAAEAYAQDLRSLDKPAAAPAPEVPSEPKVGDNGPHEASS